MAEFLFWFSLWILFYTYFGYPIILWILAKVCPEPHKKKSSTPNISIIVVVHNEEKFIEEKINNLLGLDYPKDKLEIIIGSDGSTDNTNTIIEKYCDRGIKLYKSDNHTGKVTVLNKLVSMAGGEIIVFSDARQNFQKNAVLQLAANFSNPKVGGVSGELIFVRGGETDVGREVGFYWEYEKWMRHMESEIGSIIGATGAIYAIRKELFTAPAADIVLDDVFIPLKIVEKNYCVKFDRTAIAFDKAASCSKEEFTRKVRTLAGNFQIFGLCKNLFNPCRSKLAWQLFSHKFLRAIAFIFLISLFVTNILIVSPPIPPLNKGGIIGGLIKGGEDGWGYEIFLILQSSFYILAIIGGILEKFKIKGRFAAFPYVFCVLNIAALAGFLRFIFNRQKVTWEKAHS